MDVMTLPASREQSRSGSDLIAPDCRGLNFWTLDRSVRDLLALNLDARALAHFEAHFEKFGRVAGGRLDELAMQADKRRAVGAFLGPPAWIVASALSPPVHSESQPAPMAPRAW
jgi:hypothetical protein